MSEHLKKQLMELLKLPEKDRQEIIDELRMSLISDSSESGFVAELERRGEEMKSCKDKGIPISAITLERLLPELKKGKQKKVNA